MAQIFIPKIYILGVRNVGLTYRLNNIGSVIKNKTVEKVMIIMMMTYACEDCTEVKAKRNSIISRIS
jgi:ribosomal protein L37AE/L43A